MNCVKTKSDKHLTISENENIKQHILLSDISLTVLENI